MIQNVGLTRSVCDGFCWTGISAVRVVDLGLQGLTMLCYPQYRSVGTRDVFARFQTEDFAAR